MKDLDIRREFKRCVLKKHIEDTNSVIIDEFNVSLGTVRADIAVINGVLHAYEIKSEYDTLKRLDNQVHEYNKFFEYVTIITCEKYLEKVLAKTPEKCGVILAKNISGNIVFNQARRPKKNKEIDKVCLAKALWRNEILDLLIEIKYSRGFKSKPKPLLYKILSEEFSEKQLLTIVKEKLKIRYFLKADQSQTQNDGYFQLSSMS